MAIARPRAILAELESLSVTDRILSLYLVGIEACEQGDDDEAQAVIEELLGTLDFDCGEVAEGFARLYEHCLREVQQGNLSQVAWILEDLYDTWMQAASEVTTLVPGSLERLPQVRKAE
jgi:hypothetical protein